MKNRFCLGHLTALAACLVMVAACERPPVEAEQTGYRGVGMVENTNPRTQARVHAQNVAPEPLAAIGAGGPLASDVYKNVQVLGDLSVGEFTRLMAAITTWVSPEQGCAYCHAGDDLASDALYTKVVARQMLLMTQEINSEWNEHVSTTGVTCYTCHRGRNVPENIWFNNPGPRQAAGFTADSAGQNTVSTAAGKTSLPFDPFSRFLGQKDQIRVVSTQALPAGNPRTIKDTEWTYSLMMHMSESLGVNCTFCHNSRSFFQWDGSTPQRATAWHGIQMVGELNAGFLKPLTEAFPDIRLGPLGDVAKINCGTCHQGVSKPLFGANMLEAYPSLAPKR